MSTQKVLDDDLSEMGPSGRNRERQVIYASGLGVWKDTPAGRNRGREMNIWGVPCWWGIWPTALLTFLREPLFLCCLLLEAAVACVGVGVCWLWREVRLGKGCGLVGMLAGQEIFSL